MEVFYEWSGNPKFKKHLALFNARRPFAHNGDYKGFLTTDYKETWKNREQNARMFVSKKPKYSVIFSYQADYDILYQIFPQAKKV